MKPIIHWFANLKFRYKLLLCMTAITTLALLIISQLSYAYFYNRNKDEVLLKAGDSVLMASSTLSAQFNFLAVNTNHLLLKPPFPQMVSDINQADFRGYAAYFSEGSQQIEYFLQNQDMVSNVLFCGEQDFVFSRSILGTSKHLNDLFSENIWEINQISMLPTRYNSMSNQGSVIPIIYPISYFKRGEGFYTFKDSEEHMQKARFIVLLDTGKINAYFERMSNGYTNAMYLADNDGQPLSKTREEAPYAFLPDVMDWVSGSEDIGSNIIKSDKDTLYLTAKPIKIFNLKVVHITSQGALFQDILELRNFFIAVWLGCTLLAGILAIALSSLLTRKIKLLGGIINQINDNTYQSKVTFSHTDEISILGSQLNHMYDTIKLQLCQIKSEEQKKARAEIQMMSEQINPHFLYNTLECIHFSVLNGNETTAGAMLESLGRYLRITLSMGNTMISFEKEVEHVTSYMEIMNRHSKSGIRFNCHLDPSLKSHKVIKSLLQPLAENSIKHGFGGGIMEETTTAPQITISIQPVAEYKKIKIEVSDNGKGIDIEKATISMMEEPEGDRHFGLHNIYKRLNACYGQEALVKFSSIPYFKNSVILVIPNITIQSSPSP